MRTALSKYLSDQSSDRLDRILLNAAELMTKFGVDGLTVRDLAEASGVSPTTIYNRFGTKDKLVALTIIDSYERNIDPEANARALRDEPAENLERLLRLMVRELKGKPAFSQALVVMHFKHEADREMPDIVYGMLLKRLLPITQEMATRKKLLDWVSPVKLAEEIADRLFGIAIKWVQGSIKDGDILKLVRYSVLAFLRGVSTAAQSQVLSEKLKELSTRLPESRR